MSIGDQTREEWTEKSKCVIEAWDLNDSDLLHIRPSRRQAWAEHMCDGCPVMGLCADRALRLGSSGTVWGGTWIPDSVNSNHPQEWLHRLHLVTELNRQPSQDELDYSMKFRKLPRYVMNRISADGGHTMKGDKMPVERRLVCRYGHDLDDPRNVYTPPSRPGTRECRQCIRRRRSK